MKYLMLLLSFFLTAACARADTYSVSGTATFSQDWQYSASGPSFSFAGGELQDRSFETYCTEGMICDLSAILNTGGSCNTVKQCSATLDGKTYDFLEGSLSLLASQFVPITTGEVVLPAIVSGQFLAFNCASLGNLWVTGGLSATVR